MPQGGSALTSTSPSHLFDPGLAQPALLAPIVSDGFMDIAILALVMVVPSTIAAAVGFGGMITTVTLASPFLAIGFILPSALPVYWMISIYVVLRYHKHVQLKYLLRNVMPWMLAGAVVGMLLFQLQGELTLKFMFALLVIALSSSELWKLRNNNSAIQPLSPWSRRTAIVGGGIAQGLFASGGPLVVYAIGREIEDKSQFRATITSVWLMINPILFTNYILTGSATIHTAMTTVALLPSLCIGLLMGEWIHKRLEGPTFRRAIFGLLLIGGVLLAIFVARLWLDPPVAA